MRIVLALLGCLSGPLAAQAVRTVPPPAADYAAMSDADIAREASTLDDNADACTRHFPLLREIARRSPQFIEARTAAAQAELICAYQRDDFDTAMQLLRASPAVRETIQPRAILLIAAKAGDGEEIIAALRTFMLDGDLDDHAELSFQLMRFVEHRATIAGRADDLQSLAFEVMKRSQTSRLDRTIQQSLAIKALRESVIRNDLALAKRMIALIERPEFFVELLASREFESLWADVERRVGPRYRDLLMAYEASAVARWEADRANLSLLNDAAYAKFFAKDYTGVIALADGATSRPDLKSTLREDEGWALNLKAYALDMLGRHEDADKTLDALAEAATAHPDWGVSFIINRASRLVSQERWREGFAAALVAQPIAAMHGNDYANMLVGRSKACALVGLRRAAEAREVLDVMRSKATKVPVVFAEALLCAEGDKEAVEVLISGLGEKDTRLAIIEALQPPEMDLFGVPSKLRQLNSLLANHPPLRAAFTAHARMISQAYWPGPLLP